MRLNHVFTLAGAFAIASIPMLAGTYPAGSNPQIFLYDEGVTDLQDGSVIGSDPGTGGTPPMAAVYGAALRLLDRNAKGAIGSFKLPQLDTNAVVKSFDLKFNITMNNPDAVSLAEGYSVNFGSIPRDNGTGEGGFVPLPGGLTIAFDIRDTADDPASIQVFVGNVSIANFPRTFAFGNVGRLVTIHWDSAGLDLVYDGKTVCTDLPTPGLVPRVGDTFAFTARGTTGGMDIYLDNVRASTVSSPALETGGVIISEFVANNSLFEDEFASKPGWIELYNGTKDPVDLNGWYLTDSKNRLARWKIAGTVINPYSYLVAFASGRDRQLSPTSFMHTDFRLANDAGYVALVRPDGTTVESGYEYGPQRENVSYGEAGAARVRGYMFPASPGLVNSREPAPNSQCPPVAFSNPGGLITDATTVTLSVPPVPGVEIHYTLDRTEPSEKSATYSNAIPVTGFTTIRARAVAPGYLPGPVTRATFVMLDGTLTNYNSAGKVFESNLPVIFIDSFGFNVDGSTGGTQPFRPSYVAVFKPDPATGRVSLTSEPEYSGPGGIHVRGESSAGFDQRSYALELWDESSADKDASLLGMPANSDWVLYGPWSEKSLMRNKLVFDWMLSLRGHDGTAMRTRFVELFFNQTRQPTGKVGYASYRGIYVLMEKLKRGSERVPLENLNDKTIDPFLITGGYILRQDKVDTLKNSWETPFFRLPMQSFDPDRLNTAQLNYVKGYLSNFERALQGASFRDFKTGYQAYIDADTFIDAQWMLEVAKQVDGYVFSTYFHKDRAGRYRAGPLWDFNISLGNADYATGDLPKGWLYDVANGVGQLYYPRLHADPDYRMAHWDRYWHLRRGILANARVLATIERHMTNLLDGYTGLVSNRAPASIQNPVARHFRKWPQLGVRDWPNPPSETKIRTWQAEVDYLRTWLLTRLDWLDDQTMRSGTNAYRPPVLSHDGGVISSPIQLTMQAFQRESTNTTYPAGTIYYTLDGSDPRQLGGTVSAKARTYSGPLVIASPLTVNARMLAGNVWSALATSTFLYDAVPASPQNLVISEILYRPAPPTAAESAAGVIDAEKFEFIELRNISGSPVDLNGVAFTEGVEFEFEFVPAASRLLLPYSSLLLVADKRAFQLRNPEVPATRIAGQYQGQLSNGGERLTIRGADGGVLRSFTFDNRSPWPTSGDDDTAGRSIVLASPTRNPDPAEPFNWLPSAAAGGTPGRAGTGAIEFYGDPGLDSDGDGAGDLFEFATGSDAEDPRSTNLPSARIASLAVGGVTSNYLVFEFRRSTVVNGAALFIERSENLVDWAPPAPAMVLVESRNNSDGTVTEVYRGSEPLSALGSRSVFLRLRAQLQ